MAGPVHHLRLTVTDIQRGRQFYTSLLGFQVAVGVVPNGYATWLGLQDFLGALLDEGSYPSRPGSGLS